jgi:hydrogenase maturation factor
MAINDPVNVMAAFDILLEEIEAEIETVNTAGARAFERRDYPAAQEAIKRAQAITDYRARSPRFVASGSLWRMERKPMQHRKTYGPKDQLANGTSRVPHESAALVICSEV